MCGIVGWWSADPARPAPLDAVRRMNDAQASRGPDGTGLHHAAGVALAMRRLAVIDPATGAQPMWNEDGTVAVVCNGEIYNYRELRAALGARGHRWRSVSDVEVLVHLYEERGLDFLADVNGMFALALWDAPRRRLVLARDRIGERPLHVAEHDGALWFASETRALRAGVPATPDWGAVRWFLRHNYVPGALTAWRGIRRVAPGTMVVCDEDGIRARRYWTWPAIERDADLPAPDALGEALVEATRLRLRSNVPVGVFLSGGVDSGTVAALVRDADPGATVSASFGVTFPGSRWDEGPHQRAVAQALGFRHVECPIPAEAWPALARRAQRHLDEPFGDTSMAALLALSERAREEVTVVLTGDGGDEVFGGYERYARVRPGDAPGAGWEVFDAATLDAVAAGPLARDGHADPAEAAFADSNGAPALDRALAFDRRVLLPGNNLVKPDRMGLAVGLEARCPLLDHTVVERIARVPAARLLPDPRRLKPALRAVAARRLPPALFDRPKGMLTVPFGDWARGPMAPALRAALDRLVARDLVHGVAVARLFDEHVSGHGDHTRRLRALFALDQWLTVCVEGTAA